MIQPRIVVHLGEIEELVKQFPAEVRAAREAKLTEALLLLERTVKSLTPGGAGPIHLRETMFHQVTGYGDRLHGLLGTPAIYGESLEYGTKPHFPPVGPLRYWVEKKLGLQGNEAASVAYLIARSIAKKGTKGAQMFEKGFDREESRVIGILEDIVPEILRRVQ